MNSKVSQKFGFKLLKFLELEDWKILEITKDIPFSSQTDCPADGRELSIFVTLVSVDGAQKIRIGLCKNCGYFGYIDRPSRNWIEKFYFETWDEGESKNVQEEISRRKQRVLSKDKRRKKDLSKFLTRFPIVKDRYVLEIGSGYGGTLKGIRELGFKKVVGLESSLHRAEVSRKAYNLEIFSAPFEDANLQKNLQKFSPFGLIITHHVLEHTYEPDRILNLASGLQSPGDFLIISVPNSQGEFSMGEIFFLPHLHSFTPYSLEKLLNRNGYAIADDSFTTPRNLYVLARKDNSQISRYYSSDYFSEKLEKFEKCLGFGISYSFSPRWLWWDRKIDVAGQTRFWPRSFFLERLKKWKIYTYELGIKKWLFGKRVIQSALVINLEKRFTPFEESPIEIQFQGNIKLAYK